MSRFLRFLVRLLLILFVLAGAALLVPPLIGISTVVVEDVANSNVGRGSVVYARSVDASSIESGDKVLRVTEDGAVNTYIIRSYDGSTKTITAVRQEGAAEEEMHAADAVRKVLFVVPYLGYLSIATQSLTGLLILGGCILIIIILFIISEVLRRGSEEEDEDEDTDATDEDYFSSLKDKNTDKEAAKADDAEVSDTEDAFPVEGEGEDFIKNLKGAVSGNDIPQATGELPDVKDEGAKAAPDETDQLETDGLPNVQAALEAALEGRQVGYSDKTASAAQQVEESSPKSGEIELAIPIRTAEEYLDKAHADGDDPALRTDERTGVQFVDYSDCL